MSLSESDRKKIEEIRDRCNEILGADKRSLDTESPGHYICAHCNALVPNESTHS